MNPIFYVHIPKTGGRTLATRMASAFRPERVYCFEKDFRYPDDVDLFSTLIQTKDFIEGHIWGPLIGDHQNLDILTTVREPVSRLVSSFRHIQREPRHRLYRASHALSPAEFFSNYADVFSNEQSRILIEAIFRVDRVIHVKDVYRQWITSKLADAAGRVRWLVPTEAIDDFTWLWTRESRRLLPMNDVNGNIAPHDDGPADAVRQVIQDHPELYALDLELWNWANQRMRNFKQHVLLTDIDRRVPFNNVFENADSAIWLTDGWLPPLKHGSGLLEWWAGPHHTSEVRFRRSGNQAIQFDILATLAIGHNEIRAYSGVDFQPLECRRTYENQAQPTLRINISTLDSEGTMLLNVPIVSSAVEVHDTSNDVTRRSFASARWCFDNGATHNA